MTSILCISYSPLTRDARVLRQLSILAEFGEVVTVGYGDMPPHASRHVEIPASELSLPQSPRGVALLGLRRHDAAEMATPAARFARTALGDQRFDVVVANDVRALPLAFAVAGDAPVWADLHEWAPEERTHVFAWRVLVAPFMVHLCQKYLPRTAAVTTVGGEIAALYRQRFGVTATVMRNAAPLANLTPTTVDADKIRLVHSGGAIHGRNLELMIDVVRQLDDRFSLDLYLVPAADGGRYLARLKRRAQGDPRIVFHDPVPPADLPAVLNAYDVGVFWIPPVHTNARLTLPNKLFDFVQARLAVAVGPSVEMTRLVDEYGLGVVSDDFTVSACTYSLDSLTAYSVRAFKAASDRAADELSFEREADAARMRLRELLSRGGAGERP